MIQGYVRIHQYELIIYPDTGPDAIIQYLEKFAPIVVDFLSR